MPTSATVQSVIGRQEDIDRGRLGARQVKRIEISGAEGLPLGATLLDSLIERNGSHCAGYKYLHTAPAFRIGILGDLEARHLGVTSALAGWTPLFPNRYGFVARTRARTQDAHEGCEVTPQQARSGASQARPCG